MRPENRIVHGGPAVVHEQINRNRVESKHIESVCPIRPNAFLAEHSRELTWTNDQRKCACLSLHVY